MLPFTPDILFSNLAHYNREVWPVAALAYVLGLAAVALAFRPVAGGGRAIALIMAAAWVWVGAAYHLTYFATINFAAPLYGAVFIAQGALLAWTGAVRGKVRFAVRGDPFGWAGLALVAFAMAVYPLVAPVEGHGWAGVPLFGLAPAPTAIFTLGMLLLTAGRAPVHLAVVPLLWSLGGGATAWVLGITAGLTLPLAGIAGFGLVLWKNRRARLGAAT